MRTYEDHYPKEYYTDRGRLGCGFLFAFRHKKFDIIF